MKKVKDTYIQLALGCAALMCSLFNQQCVFSAALPELTDSTQLKETVFTPVLQQEIAPGKNLVYCAAFQIAWNELMDTLIKEPVLVEGEPLVVRLLNQKFTGKEVIFDRDYVAMAGFNKDGIVEKIEAAFKEKFRTGPDIDLRLSLTAPEDILVFASLRKELAFEIEFESLPRAIFFKSEAPVKAFGVNNYTFDKPHQDLVSQVEVFSYKNDDDFIIRLRSLYPEDEIILAKIPPVPTLLEAVNQVILRISNDPYPTDLFEGETLQIPKFDFNIIHIYSDFMRKGMLNKEFSGYHINTAIQSLRFKLNENGSLLSQETGSKGIPEGKSESVPRKFIFNQPFLIMLKGKSAPYPYLAMWIENTELLLKN